jgi:hypothetical protein
MSPQANFAKGSLTQGLTNDIMTYCSVTDITGSLFIFRDNIVCS